MNIQKEIKCNLFELEVFANNLASKTKKGDIILLGGDLGVGKTTFVRFFINSLYDINQKDRPSSIKSPSYPILINYPLRDFEINHYDLYRIKNVNELSEIDILENLKKNISLVEWPNIILENFKLTNYYFLNFEIIDTKKRSIKFNYYSR